MITSETNITSCIDWISVTVEKANYPETWTKLRKEKERGMSGYDTVVQYADGRIEMCSSTREDMKSSVLLTGKTIKQMCIQYELNSFDIFRSIVGNHSRLDIAVDVKHGKLDILRLSQMLNGGKADTRAKEGLLLQGVRAQGMTLYIGSKNSKKRVRIYDKKAEAKTDYDWTRIEMQCRHKEALRISNFLMLSDEIESDIPKVINSFVSFPNDILWCTAMSNKTIVLPGMDKEQSNRERWLMTTAVRALAKEMLSGHKGEELLETFCSVALDTYMVEKNTYK